MQDREIYFELGTKVGELMDRHIKTRKEWYPHEIIPWKRGAELEFRDHNGEKIDWTPDAFPLPEEARSSLYINVLTEDNLPYYFETIHRVMGGNEADTPEAWSNWAKLWTSEEDAHGYTLRNYITLSQAFDPWILEDSRRVQISTGQTPQAPNVTELLAYVSLQELATRISHFNTGRYISPHDSVAKALMSRIATDENFHFIFYRDLMNATLEMDPSAGVIAIEKQVREFQMPGTGIPGFEDHAKLIASAHIYDLAVHYEQILVPVVLNQWKVDQLEGLNPEAEQARERLMKYMSRLEKASNRIKRKMEEEGDQPPATTHVVDLSEQPDGVS